MYALVWISDKQTVRLENTLNDTLYIFSFQ